MKDEEMAEEYADRTRIVDENTRVGTDCISLVQDYEGNYIDIHERIKQAFLAGLKAGRPQWHKVADGDLPPLNTNVLVIHRWARTPEVGKRIEVFINSSVWVWAMCSDRYRYTSDDENVIAWCEIPTFDKE